MADDRAKRNARRTRIAEAIASAVDGESIMLLELAKIWGVGKPAFVNERDRIVPPFPAASVDGNRYFYPRLKALRALDAWERRADAASAKRSDRLAALVGFDITDDSLSIGELQKANALRIEMENRLRDQGMLVAKQDMQRVAGKVFELLSKTLSALGTQVDPNGQYDPAIAAAADKAGEELLLRIEVLMRDMLAKDATLQPARSARDGGDTRRAGANGASRRRS